MKDAHASKKKTRRRPRGDLASPQHYGPVASTSGIAALVQAYLQPEPTQGMEPQEKEKSPQEIEAVLYLSESRFDTNKLRFGGKSKAVALSSGADHGGSRTEGQGSRLTFGPNARIVATREIMHDALYCRCICILLCDVALDAKRTKEDAENSKRQRRDETKDTAHLVTLSPNDLFCALSVDSFPVTTAPEAGLEKARGCGSPGQERDVSGAEHLPRAFDVMDGPVVLHRPGSSESGSWSGLEVFRPPRCEGRSSQPWRRERLLLDASCQAPGRDVAEGDAGDGDRRSSHGIAAEDIGISLNDQGCPEARKKADSVLMWCPQDRSQEEATAVLPKSGGHGCFGRPEDNVDGTAGAVVNLPAAVVPQGTANGSRSVLASLTIGEDGQVRLSPWLSLPSAGQRCFTCLCRAPPIDSGTVGLADASSGIGAGGGLVLRPLPPTVYVGASEDFDHEEPDEDVAGRRGALWELQRGRALSCARSLPAPARALLPAAVDDGRGVLVVLLADASRTALLLARDGSDFPAVEEFHGVSRAFAGDFLSNGREQVALLPHVIPNTASSSSSTAGGAEAAPQTAAASAFEESRASEWEQLPLKTLVKRALVTDCSGVWGNGQRDELATLPGAGPIQLAGTNPSVLSGKGAAAAGDSGVTDGSEAPSARKRRRVEDSARASGGSSGEIGVGTPGHASSAVASTEKAGDHRLSRLSSVVSVLRQRVQAEEARFLRLRQSRRGKIAVVEASKMMLVAQVNAKSSPESQRSEPSAKEQDKFPVDVFTDGLVPCFDDASPSAISPSTEGVERRGVGHVLQCCVARARFHAASRTLCIDATVSNLKPQADDDASRELSEVAVNVCLSVSCASGKVQTRSGVCPRLETGQSATIRACVEVSPGFLVEKAASIKGVACMWISCSWSLGGNDHSLSEPVVPHTGRRPSSVIFARILVSSQDMLEVVGFAEGRTNSPSLSKQVNREGFGNGGANTGPDHENTTSHIGLFDVGTRLDLLIFTEQPRPDALPQALRALSCLANLPEPWAGGGASARISECSERAAECTLRAGDSGGAAAVLLRVVADLLPDGVRACADHASGPVQALMIAFAEALLAEISAAERVAREHRGSTQPGKPMAPARAAALLSALESYVDVQMETDILAARVSARLAAVGDGDDR